MFYKRVRPSGSEPILRSTPTQLNIELRNYQKRAVRWMLEREMQTCSHKVESHPLWIELGCKSLLFYYNHISGLISRAKPTFTFSARGGILADEMGLGKSVELLTCILSNVNSSINDQQSAFYSRKEKSIETGLQVVSEVEPIIKCYCRSTPLKNTQDLVQCTNCSTWQHQKCMGDLDVKVYLCPDCWFHSGEKLPSNTTLIICPSAIIQQWRHEIVRRTSLSSLKILIYDGIKTPNRANQLSLYTNIPNPSLYLTLL